MNLYEISDKYIEYLRGKLQQSTVYDSEVDTRRHNRKYVPLFRYKGVVYFAPLSHGKKKDYRYNAKKKNFELKKDTQVCMYISDKNKKSLGTIQLGNLIPVPAGEYFKYDHTKEQDKYYKETVEEQIEYIEKNKNKIRDKAKTIVLQKMSGKRVPIKTIDKVPDLKRIHLVCERKMQFEKLQNSKSEMKKFMEKVASKRLLAKPQIKNCPNKKKQAKM